MGVGGGGGGGEGGIPSRNVILHQAGSTRNIFYHIPVPFLKFPKLNKMGARQSGVGVELFFPIHHGVYTLFLCQEYFC